MAEDSPAIQVDDDLSIPEFLRVENRTPAPVQARAVPLPPPEEEWQRRNRLASEARAAVRKAKNKRGFERMMARHPGERYDRKTKSWVPVDDPASVQCCDCEASDVEADNT